MIGQNLFYTYTGKWSNYVLSTTQLNDYKNSLIFHEQTKRLIYNGIIYGNGSEGNIYFVDGKSTDNDGVWTGINDNIFEYFEGLTIIYVPKVNAGTNTTTLNINNLGAKNCYINDDNVTSNHYIPNVPILFTYVNGVWKHADYGSIGSIDRFTNKVFNKNNENYTYNIVFSEKSNNDTYTFAYIDAELNYNPLTNTLHSSNFNGTLTGNVIGNVTGNASSANRLSYDTAYTAWGQTFFENGRPQSLNGSLSYVGNIIPETTYVSTLGTSNKFFSYTYSRSFIGDLYGTSTNANYSNNSNISNSSYQSHIVSTNNNSTYYIIFANTLNGYSYSYVDENLIYNPYTNTLTVNSLVGKLESLDCVNNVSNISNIDRKVITNIGINTDKKISYQYANSIGVSYFNGTSYLGEIFNNYDYNIAYGTYGSSFGSHNITYNESEVAFCSYNAYNKTQVFSIGVGTSNSNRKNALWVDINGSTYTNNIIPQANNTYNIGNTNNRYNTIYGKTFNGTTFTGRSAQVDVKLHEDTDVKYFVGFDTDTKNLYYRTNLSFKDNGQIVSTLSGNFNSDGSHAPFMLNSSKLVTKLNADYLDNFHANELLQNSYIKTEESNSGATLTYYIKVGNKEIHGKQNLYNNRLAGNNSYYAWGQKYWENGVPKSINGNIIPDTTNSYTLGNGTSYWGYSYLTNIVTKSISFNEVKTIGSNIRFIYWKDGVATASDCNIGSDTEPIYISNGSFIKCNNALSVNVKEGTANRLAYYSANKKISSGNIVSDGKYISNVSYISINNNHQTTHRLYVNGTSVFKNTINIDSSTMGLANHINFNRAAFNCINVPTNGTFAVTVNGASGTNTKLAVNASSAYPGQNDNKVDLGTSDYRWKKGYINNLITKSISFDGTTTIGSNIRFIYWKDGVATATDKTLGNSTKPIYLNGGSFTECQSYADYETSTIISFTKSIKVLKTWGDTGISGNNLKTGTYVVQMIVGTDIYYSGVVSWYKDSTSSTETDEIVLHMAGKNPTERIYLKTTMVSSGSLKLQISGEKDWGAAANIVFKFKKLI